MVEYGYIKIDNISLTEEMFLKVCDKLKLISSHYYQDCKAFYIYAINNNKEQYNVDRGSVTKQSDCFLDTIKFRIGQCFPCEIGNDLIISYKVS